MLSFVFDNVKTVRGVDFTVDNHYSVNGVKFTKRKRGLLWNLNNEDVFTPSDFAW